MEQASIVDEEVEPKMNYCRSPPTKKKEIAVLAFRDQKGEEEAGQIDRLKRLPVCIHVCKKG